ncbi:hypothetical protein [Streptomyces triticiradicis]|uniref:HEAT repeat domain-containing protein n=1 Tax=Streptomyces triticiradicis TaxID=2651189 RepID=A0A7J5DCI6_9ACTN|nr:hypothetical protein [Streptomyces triticiradicis]KAB1986331.1 hypothetical protein F8144_23370 [Streptomyces triticiradicis]
MRSPAELDDVRWSDLAHAYGPAEDVPELIRALYEDDEEAADEAVYELYGNIHHQGSVYQASAPAVPFLAHAVLHAPGKREDLLMLLAVLADHSPDLVESPHWPGSDTAAICAELRGVLPELLPCLTDPERGVRRAALRTVASVADLLPDETRVLAVERVEALYTGDPVPAVRADALIALNRFGRVLEPLDSQLSEVRLAAAQLTAERSGPPYAPELVEVFAEDGAEPDPGDDDYPWGDTTTQDRRLTDLLAREPDAALAVAARWIAAGDIGSRGSWLAGGIAEKWRDREREVLDLLLTALPHQDEPHALLRTIGHWIGHLPEPGTDLQDTLHRYASADDETAEPALLALVNSRDPRALELVIERPTAHLLEAAARHFPEAADRLIPVIRRELAAGATGNDGIALVQALEPFGAVAAAAARPELVDCLKTRRAAIVAARRLGANGVRTPEITDLLLDATGSSDPSLRGTAAVAHHRLTGDPSVALRTYEELLSSKGQTHWYLSGLEPLGGAAAPLLPLVEPLLEAGYDWTRKAAAEAHHWITGSPDRAVPVLAELAGPSPVGISALKALATTGRCPEELHPALRSYVSSPKRLLPDSPFSGQDHPDDELRTLSRLLLMLG